MLCFYRREGFYQKGTRMKKILFTDLDGTILKDDKSISEKNREAVHQMLKAGNYVVIATGRNVESGCRIAKELGLDIPGCYMIAYNGAVIYDFCAARALREYTVPMEHVKYLFAEAERYQLYIQTYWEKYMVTSCSGRELTYYATHTDTPIMQVEDVIRFLDREPNKVVLIHLEEHEQLEIFQREHRQWEQGRLHSFFSCPEYLEYCPLGIDKGSGVRYLCGYLEIPLENAYAAGDERNDIPMLQVAGTGIAVKNAHADAKAAADYVTVHDNEHDAIAEIVERFGLASF